MNEAEHACDSARIDQYLEGVLSHLEQRAFEQHLEACEPCLQRMREATVEPSWWDQPAEFLAEDNIDQQLSAVAPIEQTASLEPDDDANEDVGPTTDVPHSIDHDGLRRVLDLLTPSEDPRMLGRIGRYEVVGAIGFGGMAVVLKGFEPALHRYVAIKLLAPHLASSPSARERFSREARAAASVLHPNVIAIHSVAEFQGLPYLVMPYISGGSLQDRIDASGALDVESTVRIGMQVAAGLAAAHQQGLVHRDIKPSNILMEPGLERVVITDFGVARAADDASITLTGMLAGTPHYMSPEQARGERVDHRSDLFSLGSLLYTLIAGHEPFRAETSYGVLRRITDHPAPRLELDEAPWLGKLIRKLQASDSDARYQSTAEVSLLLAECLAYLQDPARSLPTSLQTPGNWGRRLVLTGGIAGLAAAGSASYYWANRQQVPRSTIPSPPPVVWPPSGKWVTVHGQFHLDEIPQPTKPIEATRDKSLYERVVIPDETLIVDPDSGGIANLFIWLELAGEAQVHPDDAPPPAPAHVQYRQGRLDPRALILRGDQSLVVRNTDPIKHTLQFGPRRVGEVPAGQHVTRSLAHTEMPVPITCQYHPWFRSYILCLTHPWAAITDAQGHFQIDRIPSGVYKMRIWHESTGPISQLVTERGFVERWPGGARTIDLDRPHVDLGELIPVLRVDRDADE